MSYTIYTMRTSYSAIDTYLQCPQKYKFQEIDRIRVPKSFEAIFGTIIHETLKFTFERNPLYPTLDEVINHFREHWPTHDVLTKSATNDPLKRPLSPDEEKIYFEEGVRMLKRFYEKNAPWNFSVVDLESRFEVLLQDEKTGESHILAGIIDRIDKHPDGTYEIIDYKTSKRMPSQDMLDRNLQLSLYSLGLNKRWPHINIEDIKLSLYFLKHEEKLTTKRNLEAIEKTKAHILKTIAEIQERLKEHKEFEPMPSVLCNWCEYRPQCPAWRHLYRKIKPSNENPSPSDAMIENELKEFFILKKTVQEKEKEVATLQARLKNYMQEKKLTRLFGDEGTLTERKVQKFEYDMEKVKVTLSPLHKWEEILKMDETKLKRILKEIPEEARMALDDAKRLIKEYTMLTTSLKKFAGAEDISVAEESENNEPPTAKV